ncbi:hypothetical protein D3C74_352780 [compost metagenome]
MSSNAALPVRRSAGEPPSVNLTESKLVPNAPASMSSDSLSSASWLSAESHTSVSPASAFSNSSGPATRSNAYWYHMRVGHWSAPPSAIGVTPCALRVSTAARSSSHVWGASMPASARTCLLWNSMTGCVPRMGMP